MIYVDDAAIPAKIVNGPAVHDSQWSHLTADSLPELHRFATNVLGLRRSYFQDGTFPHYDLTAGMRFKAIRNGARQVDVRESPDIARRLAETRDRAEPEPIVAGEVLRRDKHGETVQCGCGRRFRRNLGETHETCLPCSAARSWNSHPDQDLIRRELTTWATHNAILMASRGLTDAEWLAASAGAKAVAR